MLTAAALGFIALAMVMALRNGGGSPRGAFQVSRERLRADAKRPTRIAAVLLALALFLAANVALGSSTWHAALFALAVGSAFVGLVFWLARR